MDAIQNNRCSAPKELCCFFSKNWQWQLGAMSLFSCYTNILLFMRRIPGLGLYIVMMTEIMTTFFKFFIAFFMFIVAFAMAFYVLLQNQVPLNVFSNQ